MRLVDTHCHLNDRQAFPDPAPAVDEALAAGVVRLVVVGVDTDSSRYAVELAERFEEVYAVVGWHPTSTATFSPAELPALREMLAHPKVVALGEIGLDYHWDYATPEQQAVALRAQLDLAAELEEPVVFHCREAYPDLLDVLEREPGPRRLFHCFAGDATDASRAVALGAWFGVDGPVTYRKADALREVLAGLPRDRVVVETDAPWMAPHPFRGKPNRPAWVTYVNEGLASVWGVTPEVCAGLTTAAAQAFFGPLGLSD